MTLIITVHGRPAPQGSKDLGQHGQMRESSPHLPAWRQAIKAATYRALCAVDIAPDDRPVFPAGMPMDVFIRFHIRKPPGTKYPDHPTTAQGSGDTDKLIRGVLDALTQSKVWHDDDQAIRITAEKAWATEAYPPGATIRLKIIGD